MTRQKKEYKKPILAIQGGDKNLSLLGKAIALAYKLGWSQKKIEKMINECQSEGYDEDEIFNILNKNYFELM